jgi:MoaA/NifB/PqqE/SkfB family radical SAM enzyme
MKSLAIIPIKNLGRVMSKAIKSPGFAIHSFYRRFLSYLTYRFGNGYSAPPETISFFLTYKCNLRCKMCGQWGEHGVFKDYSRGVLNTHLSLDTIKEVLNDVRKFNPTITLFGGEPMLYDGWIDILREAKEKGMRCNMVTNAVFLSRYAEEVVRYGLDEIIFSLDGPREIHDRVRGVEGTFDRAMTGFKSLKEIKKKEGKDRPYVTVNSTINELNYDCLDEIVKIAEEIDAYHLNIHHLLFLDRDTCDRNNSFFKREFGEPSPDWYGFVWDKLPPVDVDLLLKDMDRIRGLKSKVQVSFYPNFTEEEIREYYTGWEFESKSYTNRCISPWMVAYIFPDGAVKPYHTMNYVPGNVNEQPFTRIWNNGRYRKFRRVLKKRKRFEVCSKGCTELYRY